MGKIVELFKRGRRGSAQGASFQESREEVERWRFWAKAFHLEGKLPCPDDDILMMDGINRIYRKMKVSRDAAETKVRDLRKENAALKKKIVVGVNNEET